MSKSIRFLGFAILAWAGVRAISLGLVPGTSALAFDSATARPRSTLPPIAPSLLPPIDPLPSQQAPAQPSLHAASYPYGQPYPIYVPLASAGRSAPPQIIYVSPPAYMADARIQPAALPVRPNEEPALRDGQVTPVPQVTPSFSGDPTAARLKRLSLSSWAVMRKAPGPDGLASGAMLGGSQVGARLLWQATPSLAASVRASAPVNSQRGVEGAVGVRYQPFASVPLAFTLERRHRFRAYGQNGFAAFAEAGLYSQPLPWQAMLDGYLQAGVVDFNDPDWFVDGQLAVTRPVWNRLSAGFGLWGGGQPGLARLDAGPRLTVGLGRGMKMHLDYRQNLAGNAAPGSGGVMTLAGDF